ncbi:hypothetical protein K1719_000007 [Acacia pycnantha]|nr:hypothetical protein K1719_000007 [Acacia pycnantha]
MASASKRLKTDHRPPPRRNVASSSDEKNEKAATPAGGLQAPEILPCNSSMDPFKTGNSSRCHPTASCHQKFFV